MIQHSVHVLIQVKNNDDGASTASVVMALGLTDLAMSMSSMWPRRVAGCKP